MKSLGTDKQMRSARISQGCTLLDVLAEHLLLRFGSRRCESLTEKIIELAKKICTGCEERLPFISSISFLITVAVGLLAISQIGGNSPALIAAKIAYTIIVSLFIAALILIPKIFGMHISIANTRYLVGYINNPQIEKPRNQFCVADRPPII